jgi:hypothetical protein
MPPYHAHSWPSVAAFYRAAASQGPRFAHMAGFVARLAASPYARALHPVTSHDLLRLFAHETWDFLDDQIHVEHDGESFVVRYVASGRPHNATQSLVRSTWHRRDPDGWAALERCLDHLRWVPAVGRSDPAAG